MPLGHSLTPIHITLQLTYFYIKVSSYKLPIGSMYFLFLPFIFIYQQFFNFNCQIFEKQCKQSDEKYWKLYILFKTNFSTCLINLTNFIGKMNYENYFIYNWHLVYEDVNKFHIWFCERDCQPQILILRNILCHTLNGMATHLNFNRQFHIDQWLIL